MSFAAPNVTFHERVDDALRDQILHTALDRATGRFQTLRVNALASLPDADAVRDRARMIRAHTLSSLDTYLERFASNVERAGGHIHFARDAAALNRIVSEIARKNNVKNVVKSKSMISEETKLNDALEAEGIRVVETDLGEYIAQLAHEHPSHIIVPVIHKTKEQIGELLHEKIGIPYYDDPAQMTAAAREKLRFEFLNADMGISGVNFGVAATGTICMVTNEGNGRLTTTAPRIHVALMGIERLVPTLDDLSVMLQVLARSATGQKITVYTNLITGARRAGEGDGPDELHIILLDNGRSRVLGTEVAEILYCIRCGACLNACPVYREIGGHAYGSVYQGPVGAVLTPALGGIAQWSDLPQASSLCGACREVCPVRIDIPRMLLVERDQATRAGKMPLWLRAGLHLYSLTVRHPALFGLATMFSRIGSRVVAAPTQGWIRWLPPPLNAWTRSRDFPAFAAKPFHTQFNKFVSQRGKNREG
ncbi:MAG TPA: LutB/LldF family L-lactate oxidation iron-sulfur protein [Anaerolineae bacterium]|nr:LutB/LldF family L-lactate oxidation iron-sulfur protein [Anaerolineae bacterium]